MTKIMEKSGSCQFHSEMIHNLLAFFPMSMADASQEDKTMKACTKDIATVKMLTMHYIALE